MTIWQAYEHSDPAATDIFLATKKLMMRHVRSNGYKGKPKVDEFGNFIWSKVCDPEDDDLYRDNSDTISVRKLTLHATREDICHALTNWPSR